ncbi:MAG: type I-E CRISPR-associated protein Cas7/Cse4/CasC [Methylococcaceae bacterium]|nr:type I-E CRISPR-associated protein Cas7/Cse4/CasC [Methylococcaceae bacterium]
MTTTHPYQGQIIEFHILQSFPVSCLNRDDVGSPKSAIVGGVQRARVSSQCWKRQVRLAMQGLGVQLGVRTKRINKLVVDACYQKLSADNLEITDELSDNIAQLAAHVSKILDDKSSADKKTEEYKASTLIFLSNSDATRIAAAMSPFNFSLAAVDNKLTELSGTLKTAKKEKNTDLISSLQEEKKSLEKLKSIVSLLKEFNGFHDGLDIALFGRMVANAPTMSVEAASSFSHAISTHKSSSEVEFFTALDDLKTDEETGSAHMGSLEFNSATYYRYISLDLGQLHQTLAGENLPDAIDVFTKSLFQAVPSARQTTQSAASPWEYAKILVRKGQRLQIPFDKPVRAEQGGGYLQPSIESLSKELAKKEKLAGSLFGKQAEYTFGEDETYSIDDLVADLKSHVEA